MPKRWYRIFQAVLLLALFFFLGSKVVSNQLSWYINPRFVTLTQIGILFLGVLVYRLIRDMEGSFAPQEHDEHDHDHTSAPVNLLIMLIPLLVGILIPARPLGSATVSTKGLTTSSPIINSQSGNSQLVLLPEERTIVGWVTLFYYEEDIDQYIGEQASVIGFVYFDEDLPNGQFFVSRIILSCCAADGYAVAMIVDWPNAASLKQDTWVRVTGPVEKALFADDPQVLPLIRAEMVEIVPQPDQPYLYP
jgi:putative membrane protein